MHRIGFILFIDVLRLIYQSQVQLPLAHLEGRHTSINEYTFYIKPFLM